MTASAASDVRYDTRLATAAAQIAAERVGELRGSFTANDDVEFVATTEKPAQPPVAPRVRPRPGQWVNGLAIAVEPKRTVSPEL